MTRKSPAARLPSRLLGGLVLSVAVMSAAEETAPPAGASDACDGLFRLANTMDFDQAFHPDWEERAVPYDRVEVQAARATMYLPPGIDVMVRGYRLDGSPVFERELIDPPLGVPLNATPVR